MKSRVIRKLENGDREAVISFLEAGGDPNERDVSTGNTLLTVAAELGDCDIGRYLLERGANPNGATFAWPIHFAAGRGHVDFVELLLEYDAEVNCADEDGGTPLADAAAEGHIDVVRVLLEAGAEPSTSDKLGKRPIIYAAENGCEKVVELLSPFSTKQDIRIAKLRLQFSNSERNDQFDEIEMATIRGEIGRVAEYIENGGDPNAFGLDGSTLLFSAANRGHIEILKYLLDHGANPNHVNENGASALSYAINADSSTAYDLLFPLTNEQLRRTAERDKDRKRKSGFLSW